MKNVLTFTLIIFNILNIFGQDFYVSTTGNDTNTGTLSSPFATIQNAIDNVTAGSTIYILSGTYSTETIWLDNIHGSINDTITIKNYQNDEVIINGLNLTTDAEILYIENASFIKIENIILKNNERNNASGILVVGNCQNITINNCEITNINFSANSSEAPTSSDNAYPLLIFGDNGTEANSNIIITNNKIHDCRTGWSEGLAINGNIDGFEIRNNEVYNISNIGIDAIGYENAAPENDYARNGIISQNTVHNCPSPYADCAGIYIDGARNIIIERNLCYNNQYGIEIGNEHAGTTTQDITVRNNIIHSNTYAGVLIGGYTGEVTSCTVSGNTVYGNNTSNTWRGELELSDKLSNTIIENNIFSATNTDNLIVLADGTEPNGISLNYNVYYQENGSSTTDFDWYGTNYNFSEFQNNTSNATNSNFGFPNFNNVNIFDFHLQNLSFALDAGNPNYIVSPNETDFEGNDRIIGNTINCGALEKGMPALVKNNFTESDKIKIYPNPTYDQITIESTEIINSIEIFDITGKNIQGVKTTHQEFKTQTHLSVSTLKNGLYYIKINNNNTVKFIKQ